MLNTEINQDDLRGYTQDNIIWHEFKGYLLFLKAQTSENQKPLLEEAKDTLQRGLNLAEDFAPSGSGAGMTCRMLAEVYLYSEDYAKASEYAQRAFRISTKINERYELGILHWVFSRLAEHDGDYQRAETNLALSKKILTEIGAAYELKRLHTSVAAPQPA